MNIRIRKWLIRTDSYVISSCWTQLPIYLFFASKVGKWNWVIHSTPALIDIDLATYSQKLRSSANEILHLSFDQGHWSRMVLKVRPRTRFNQIQMIDNISLLWQIVGTIDISAIQNWYSFFCNICLFSKWLYLP